VSVVIDLIGVITYGVPFIGEIGDVVWAPISSSIIYYLYGNVLLSSVGFLEEIIPGTDFVPTATIGWLNERFG